MMNVNLIKIVLSALLIFSGGSFASNQAHAFTVFSGHPGVGAFMATISVHPNHRTTLAEYLKVWFVVFIIDSGQVEVELQVVNTETAAAAGLSDVERDAFNGQLDEIDMALSKVVDSLDESSTPEDVLNLIENEANVVGEDAIKGLIKLINYNQTT